MSDSMYGPSSRPDDPAASRARLRPGRLWAGGLATAVVAALVVVVGVLLVRGVLNIPVLAPSGRGTYGDSSTTSYAVAAAAAALLATALLHLLLVAVPRPVAFFGWIGSLATAAAVLLPLTVTDPVDSALATAAINLVTGVAIVSLLCAVASAAVQRPEEPRPPPPGYYG
ncbi:DUF6069 family protein [Actinomadura harenae]|uniref:Uncharacterized protein n=1 Tax=Actinomadura harenae TaxID=2483351 RepID=A0A3M2LSQ6_9ACTN|nr:DUF6069 family protein [Actinomadura harenae]RMI40437.1 hypothetical protein EBO15_26635 [Actinomadura harenae]